MRQCYLLIVNLFFALGVTSVLAQAPIQKVQCPSAPITQQCQICGITASCPTLQCPASGICADGSSCTTGCFTCAAPSDCGGEVAYHITFDYQNLYSQGEGLVSPQEIYWQLALGGVTPGENIWTQLPAEETICVPAGIGASFSILVAPEDEPSPLITPSTNCPTYSFAIGTDSSGYPVLDIYESGSQTGTAPLTSPSTAQIMPIQRPAITSKKLVIRYPLPKHRKLKPTTIIKGSP